MNQKYLYIETYGCQMNFNDSEVVAAVLEQEGYTYTEDISKSSIILINTCSIRENAENKVFQRLNVIKKMRKDNPDLLIGVIGCMAERLREQLFDNKLLADIVAGPDAYRNLPNLVKIAQKSKNAIDVHLSETETYDDITPYRVDNNRISAFVSIMRGCNNYCTYCIVPYTRGKERSRDLQSIIDEVLLLDKNGYKEVTLLGQNVNSYHFTQDDENFTFPQLLEIIAQKVPNMRVRFTTSHPKDMDDELLHVIARNKNIGRWIHLPVQSGSTTVLKRMNRKYTSEWYMNRIKAIKEILPEAAITTDILTGFCGETPEEHAETLQLMKDVEYDSAYMFKYSERPGTSAAKTIPDDVDDDIKLQRLNEIIALQNQLSDQRNKADIGKIFEVLVEGTSKKNSKEYKGRNSQNKTIIFPRSTAKLGDFVQVKILSANSATLIGEIVEH